MMVHRVVSPIWYDHFSVADQNRKIVFVSIMRLNRIIILESSIWSMWISYGSRWIYLYCRSKHWVHQYHVTESGQLLRWWLHAQRSRSPWATLFFKVTILITVLYSYSSRFQNLVPPQTILWLLIQQSCFSCWFIYMLVCYNFGS